MELSLFKVIVRLVLLSCYYNTRTTQGMDLLCRAVLVAQKEGNQSNLQKIVYCW